MYYLYRFLDKNGNVIYVGRTDQPLIDRINTHNHLPERCYKDRKKIEYSICKDKPTLVIYELYYINKWKPKYNTVQKYKDEIGLQLPELTWELYNPKDFFQNNTKNKKKKKYGIEPREKRICTNKKVWSDFKNAIDKYPKKTIEEFIELVESREINNLLPPDIENIIEYRGKDYDNGSDLNRLTLCFGITYHLKGVIGGRNANFWEEWNTDDLGQYYRFHFSKDKLSYWYWYIFENYCELQEEKQLK